MLTMAKGMKEFANTFKSQFEKDEKVMKQIEDVQEKNMDKTQEERDRLAKVQKGVFSSFF